MVRLPLALCNKTNFDYLYLKGNVLNDAILMMKANLDRCFNYI